MLRLSNGFIRQQEAAGNAIDLYVSGKKGFSFFNFQKRPITQRFDQFADMPRYVDAEQVAEHFIKQFVSGQIDSLHVAYMNFVSAGVQKPEVLTLLPLAGVHEESATTAYDVKTIYDFSPSPMVLLDELLPLTVKAAMFQCFLDATTSENVARMVSMKSATDNADKMVKSLTMQYNRARQSQITTELSEIMGGVESMKGAKE